MGDGSDKITIGDNTKHILGYLQDFLFTPERARTEVRFLSGGERNRALLATLMTKPANVIVLDEPTNDLDSETLELLEEQLVEFAGTLLMVSHDRTFLNNVVTSTIVFEEGDVNEYVGGYDDWRAAVGAARDRRALAAEKDKAESESRPTRHASIADRSQETLVQRKARTGATARNDRATRRGDRRPARCDGRAELLPSSRGDTIADDAAKLKEFEADLGRGLRALGRTRVVVRPDVSGCSVSNEISVRTTEQH